ncbi:rhomboid family intramembrane serine protease [Roseibacterium sp. SDUM158017]|uniref:rhomboid family intramembrane serine protease n=1 Tax=Roseicyclus salinarum TaxID=3036773 RepID=UPI0024152BA8|nr:rhomboid family intramembrane serine protease [Roseibacterium sp. SDUM158017]MDG4648529.1 rhomboid family intramembrane serine protease [Roseibacterium sp. SDUM158017]
MFPIRDHNPSDRTPFVTWALIVLNTVVFLSYFPSLSGSERLLLAFYDQWALVPAETVKGIDTYTILTSMFLHGGWMHLIGNMLFLFIFGDNLEDRLGHLGFLLFYLASGLAAAAGQILADPVSSVPMVGASGAIAGVMGGYLLMFPRARIDVLVIIVFLIRIFTIPAWLMLGIWFGLQLVNGLSMDVAGGGVAYWAHAGGFVAGLVLMLPVFLRRGGPAYWASTHGKPPHEEVEYVVSRPRRSSIPRVRRVRSTRTADRPLADLSRVPRTGQRRGPRTPWTGGRD